MSNLPEDPRITLAREAFARFAYDPKLSNATDPSIIARANTAHMVQRLIRRLRP